MLIFEQNKPVVDLEPHKIMTPLLNYFKFYDQSESCK